MALYVTSFSFHKLMKYSFPYRTDRINDGKMDNVFWDSFCGQGWQTLFVSGCDIDNHIASLLHCMMLLNPENERLPKKLSKRHRDVLLSGCDYLPKGSFIWNELDQHSDERISRVAQSIGMLEDRVKIVFEPRYWKGAAS